MRPFVHGWLQNMKTSEDIFSHGLKGYLSSLCISIEQLVMVSGIVYAFLGFVVHDRSCAVEFTNYGGPTGAWLSFRFC